jgi:hypothetical protein
MEAVGWGKEVAGYCEKKYGMNPISTFIDSFGKVGTIRWMTDFNDLAACEKVQTQMMSDQDYWKLVNKAATSQLFIDGQTEDHICRSL